MIRLVTNDIIRSAAEVHAAAWRESHKSFCSPEFVALHTTERQEKYLKTVIEGGALLYMLVENEKPVGIVSILGNLIENLYVLPEQQGKGYGSKLLQFAIERCSGVPTLWILNNNHGAKRLYERFGFSETGSVRRLSETLSELEMTMVK